MDILTLSDSIILLLVLIGFLSGAIDSLAGNGGLITVPALMALGVPPIYALGTNKLQEPAGQIVATYYFYKSKELKWDLIFKTSLFAAVGISLGAILVQSVHVDLLQKIIPILLMLVLVYAIFSGRLFTKQSSPRVAVAKFSSLFGMAIGFYSGFFGPGTGSLCAALFIFYLAMDAKNATIQAKPVNLICNAIAVIWFIIKGNVLIKWAIPLAIGQVFGAFLGAKLVVMKGNLIVKPFFVGMATLLTINLLVRAF